MKKVTWREQFKMVESKVPQIIAILCKTCKALRTLYKSFVKSYMSYCCEIWGNTYQSRLKQVPLLQKKAIRLT